MVQVKREIVVGSLTVRNKPVAQFSVVEVDRDRVIGFVDHQEKRYFVSDGMARVYTPLNKVIGECVPILLIDRQGTLANRGPTSVTIIFYRHDLTGLSPYGLAVLSRKVVYLPNPAAAATFYDYDNMNNPYTSTGQVGHGFSAQYDESFLRIAELAAQGIVIERLSVGRHIGLEPWFSCLFVAYNEMPSGFELPEGLQITKLNPPERQ